jgi:hypothetical protein
MGVKEKLGELVTIISTGNSSCNQLDEIVWDLLKDINLITTTDNLSIYSYKSNKPNYIFCHSLEYESNGISKQLINKIIKNIL